MIATTEELREYLKMLAKVEGPPSPDKAEQLLSPLEDAFTGWDEQLLGDLMLSVGMLLVVRRGNEGVMALTDTLTEMLEILHRRQEMWRNLN